MEREEKTHKSRVAVKTINRGSIPHPDRYGTDGTDPR